MKIIIQKYFWEVVNFKLINDELESSFEDPDEQVPGEETCDEE